MADFYQNGEITTLHALGPDGADRREAELVAYARRRPVALVLPCLYSELQGPALAGILEHLARVPYLHEVVVTLGVAGPDEFAHAREYFARLPQPVRVLWNDGPRVGEVKARIRAARLPLGEPGKGLAAWLAYGYLLGDERVAAVALHDCDIVTYDRGLLDRLVYPVVHPSLGYAFCKGYYARVTDRLHGRVTRMFVSPLLAALETLLGPLPLIRYLGSFRYPLAGEFSMAADVARTVRTPADWGLEVGTLADVFRSQGPGRVCQVDLDLAYEHKHQETGVGASRPQGLVRMAREIAGAVLQALAAEGAALSDGFFRGLGPAFLARAEDAADRYAAVAAINGLAYDRHGELVLAESFGRALEAAADAFRERPTGTAPIPGWNRVAAAVPGIHDQLRAAVDADNGG